VGRRLTVSIGQHSSRGRKAANQDFYGALIPGEPALSMKGIAVALADGISSSSVSGVASGSAIRSFLTDYYCTSEAWSVKTSAQRVIAAVNSWLYAETRRSQYAYDRDKGYVCTFSVMVLKSGVAHIFHVGDARVCRVAGRSLDQITEDHRVIVSSAQSYLGRALGINPHVEIDYRTVRIERGDVFVLTTDGVHDHIGAEGIVGEIEASPDDLDGAARRIVERAYEAGSPDNLTIQIVRVETMPPSEPGDLIEQAGELAPAPLLDARMVFDGYRILRTLHSSSRSHVYLASDVESGAVVVLKAPSIDLRDDPAYLTRFMMEEWIARRLNSPHVLRVHPQARTRSHLYLVLEYVDGQTLAQWMLDHPNPDLETVRRLVEQIAKGLSAFHRKEMVHQDLQPQNIMVDTAGTARIIDFGSTKVAGVAELEPDAGGAELLGTAQYTAPECFLGEAATQRSDIFSLGVIAYQMLTGRLPYGAEAARLQTRVHQRKLRYRSAKATRPSIPEWVDGALKKAVHPFPPEAVRGRVGVRPRSPQPQPGVFRRQDGAAGGTGPVALLESALAHSGFCGALPAGTGVLDWVLPRFSWIVTGWNWCSAVAAWLPVAAA